MDSKFFTSHAKQLPPAVYSVNKAALANATELGSWVVFLFIYCLQKSQNYVFLYVYAQVQLQQDRQFQQ